MGILHAFYGLGALAAPLAATHFAHIPRWNFHFLLSLGISVINTIVLVAAFKLKDQDGKLIFQFIQNPRINLEAECLTLAGEVIPDRVAGEEGTFKEVMKCRAVHLLAFFILIYVGVEVTSGGERIHFHLDLKTTDGLLLALR